MNDEDARVDEAINDLIRMRDSAGWRIMVMQLREIARTALMKIEKIDPDDATAVRALQAEVRMYRAMVDLPERLIQSARSDEQLAEMDEDIPGEFHIEREIEEDERTESYH